MPDFQDYLSILDAEPAHEEAVSELEKYARRGALAGEEACAALDQARSAHHARGNYELVNRLLDAEIAGTGKTARLAELTIAKGKLLSEDLLKESAAIECFNSALELTPENQEVSEIIAQSRLVKDNWQKIVGKYKAEAEAQSDRALKTSLYLSAAETAARHDPTATDAQHYLERALEIEPRNRRAAIHLERRLREAEDWVALDTFLEQRIEIADREERVQALVTRAVVAKTHLSRPDLAIECMKKALSIDPSNVRALKVLDALYTAEENWSALVNLYEAALKARSRTGQTPESELVSHLQIAMILWTRLEQLDAAEEHFRSVRKIDPTHDAMLSFYRAYHTDRGENAKLGQVLQQAFKAQTDATTKRELGVEIAKLAEQSAGNPERAIDYWKMTLRQTPDDPEARQSLVRLYRQTEKWNALLELLKEEIDAIPVDDEAGKLQRAERLMEIVAIYRDRLSLDVMVINTYNTILALLPGHLESLDALAEKFEQLGRWTDLVAILQRKADAPELDAEVRANLLRRIAGLWTERFGNHAQAIAPLESLLATDPTDKYAIEKLQEIYAKRRQWRPLLELQKRQVDSLGSDERRQRLCDMARVAAEKLNDIAYSISCWNRILEDDPFDTEALFALVNLYQREKRYHAVAELRHRQVEIAGDDVKAAVGILEKLGSVYAEKLGEPGMAAKQFQHILDIDPNHGRAMRVLRDLYAQAGDIDALEKLYGAQGAWADLFDVLHGVVDRLTDDAAKLRALSRIAHLATEKLGAPGKAAKAFERILTIDPQNLQAAQSLLPIYQDGQKWARLLSAYEVLLGHAEDVDAKLEILSAIGELCEQKLGSKALAFQWAARAYEVAPHDEALLAEFERLGAEADAWEQVAAIFRTRSADESVADAERVRLARQLARICEHRLHKPDDARTAWETVLELAPDDDESLDALEALASQQGRYSDQLSLQRRRAEREEDLGKKVDMLFHIAQLEEDRVNDLEAAAGVYERILELDPSSQRALRALSKVQEERGDASGLVRTLERELERARDTEERVGLLLRIGGLHAEKLGQVKEAIERYRAALMMQPGNRNVHVALEQHMEAGSAEAVTAADMMVPIYEREGANDRLAIAIEILRAAETDEDRRLSFDQRLAVLYRGLANTRKGYEAGARVFVVTPYDLEMREVLFAQAEELSAFEDFAAQYEKVIGAEESTLDSGTQRELASELAMIYQEKLSRPAEAEVAWRRVLEIEENDDPAFLALERLLRTAERWDDLAELLQRREQTTLDPDRRRQLLLGLCELYEGAINNPAAALDAYRRVLENDPTVSRAYKALARLYQTNGQWSELEDLLAREASHADTDEEILSINYVRATIRADHLEDEHGAVDLAEEVLRMQPAHTGTVGLLERLFKNDDLRLVIARILAPIYEEEKQWAKLVKALGAELEFAEHPGESIDLLVRIATIQDERLADEKAAFASWLLAIKKDPEDQRPRKALILLGKRLNRWPEVIAAYEEAIANTSEGDVSLLTAMHRELALVFEKLGEGTKAASAYQKVLDLDPGNVETGSAAAAVLVRLYAEQDRHEELINILRKQAEWAETPEVRAENFARIAKLQEQQLSDPEAAIATWRDILNEDYQSTLALDALERLFTEKKDARELISVLEQRIGASDHALDKRGYLARVAALHELELEQLDEATTSWLEILDLLPEDIDALRQVVRLYRRATRWSDVYDTSERLLTLTDDPTERFVLLFDLGVILRDELDRREEALGRFREILADVANPPTSVEQATDARTTAIWSTIDSVEKMLDDDELKVHAAEILRPIYGNAGQFEKMIMLYEIEIDGLYEAREKIARLREMAHVKEEKLGDISGAFETMLTACRQAASEPDLGDFLSTVERLAGAAGRIQDMVSLYRELAPGVFDADLQRKMHMDIADIARTTLGDQPLAIEYYLLVLEQVPDDPHALQALEILYRETRSYEALREVLQVKADTAEDEVNLRVQALVEIARICEDKLDELEDAIIAWRQVIDLSPANADAATALDRIFADGKRWVDLVEVLEVRVGVTPDPNKMIVLRFRLAQLYKTELADPERAIENFEAVLAIDPEHTEAIRALEKYLDDPDMRVHVAESMEAVYIRRQSWANLVRIAEIRLEGEADPAVRLALTKRVSRMYEEQLEDLNGAFRWYGRVFVEDPYDEAIREQLLRLAAVLEKWDDLAEIYHVFLENGAPDVEVGSQVAQTLAEIYDLRLSEIEKARDAYRRILLDYPDVPGITEKLQALLSRGERWADLVDAFRDGIDAAADPAMRKSLFLRIAEIQEQRLDSVAEAIDAYRAAADIDPDDQVVLDELDRLYVRAERWDDLAELLSNRIDRPASDDVIANYRVRLAEVMETQLDDIGGAVEQHEQALGQNLSNDTAIKALERLILHEQHRQRVGEILELVYRRNDWWQKLVVVLDAQLEFVDEPTRRTEMLLEMADLQASRGGNVRLAFKALSRAWLADKTSEPLYERMCQHAESMKAWGLLIETLQKGIDDLYDMDLAARVLRDIARIHEEGLEDPLAAIGAWERVLEAREDDIDAMKALERLYVGERRMQDLVRVLQKRSELVDDNDRIGIFCRLADLNEKALGNPEAAVQNWEQVLSVDPNDLRALDALERLHRATGDYQALVEVLRRKADSAGSAERRRVLHFRLATVYEEHLDDTFEAMAQYKEVLDENANDMDALAALDRLYTDDKNWIELVAIVDREARLEQNVDPRIELMYRAAELVRNQLGEPEQSIERYREILSVIPLHQSSLNALETLAQNEDNLHNVLIVLEPIYANNKRWDDLVGLYERKLGVSGADPQVRRGDHAALARIHEDGRNDLPAAFAVWATLVREEPEDASAQVELDRIAEQRGDWQALVDVYRVVVDDIMDGELGRAMSLKLAMTYESALGDLNNAATFYQRALDFGGDDDVVPLEALSRIYESEGSWVKLAEVFARQAQSAATDDEQATLFFRIGDLREQRLNDLVGAVSMYRDALERVPRHSAAHSALERLMTNSSERRAVIDVLEPIYENDANFSGLLNLLNVKLSDEESPEERAVMLGRIAEIAEHELGDKVGALDAIGLLLAEDPSSEQAAEDMQRLANELGRQEEAVARFEGVLDNTEDVDIKRNVGLRQAQLLLGPLADPARAERAYRRVLQVDSENKETLVALEQIYRTAQDAANLASIVWRRAELSYEPTEKRTLYAEVGKLREENLGDDAGAIVAWKEVVALEEGDHEAHGRLIALYTRLQAHEELLDTLELAARFAGAPGDEVIYRRQAAEVLTNELAEMDRAADAWSAVVDLQPEDESALSQLIGVHRRREDWPAVEEAMSRKLSVTEDVPAKVSILLELAQLAKNEQQSPDDAIGHYFNVLDLDSSNSAAYDALERVLSAQERWHDVVELLSRRADAHAAADDSPGEIALLMRAADLWRDPIGNPDAAAEILERVREREPNHVPALTGLAKIYESAEDWDRCGEILQYALQLGPTGREAADLHFRLGRSVELRGGEPSEALAHYQQALACDDNHPDALAALEEVARNQEDWPQVVALLAKREAQESDKDKTLALSLELARLYRDKLGRAGDALPYLERAYTASPNNADVAEPLADLYVAAGRAADAEAIYDRLVDVAKKERRMKDVGRIQERLGAMREASGDEGGALASYEEAFRLDPSSGATMAGLGRLYFAKQDWEKARRVYRSMLLLTIDDSVGLGKADVYHVLGLIHANLGEQPKAKNMIRRGLELEPGHEGLQQAMAQLGEP